MPSDSKYEYYKFVCELFSVYEKVPSDLHHAGFFLNISWHHTLSNPKIFFYWLLLFDNRTNKINCNFTKKPANLL